MKLLSAITVLAVLQGKAVVVVVHCMTKPVISIVIPALNEADAIVATLVPLQTLRKQGFELLLADGGSSDETVALAAPLVDTLIQCEKGRALQMNAGAKKASGQWLLFLHADTQLPKPLSHWFDTLETTQSCWGFFPIRLSGESIFFRWIERAINWRSKLSAVATGDQCIFVRREPFFKVGGYQNIPLMEDVALSKALRKLSSPLIFSSPVISSSRRWEQYGVFRTVLLMWRLRLAYFLGVKPASLVKHYG
jgi:rSAM/selenodomain-associated transferase 2